MRKRILTLLCLFAVGFSAVAFAENVKSSEEMDEIVFQVRSLGKKGISSNEAEISALTQGLSLEEKQDVYNACMLSNGKTWLGFGLNVVAGYGIGSFVQGNVPGGVTQLVVDLAGSVCYFSGLCMMTQSMGAMMSDVIIAMFSAGNNYHTQYYDAPYSTTMQVLIFGGLGLIAVGRIVGAAWPFGYRSYYNSSLEKAIGISDVQAMVVPAIDPVENKYGLVAVVRF